MSDLTTNDAAAPQEEDVMQEARDHVDNLEMELTHMEALFATIEELAINGMPVETGSRAADALNRIATLAHMAMPLVQRMQETAGDALHAISGGERVYAETLEAAGLQSAA